MKKTNKFRQLLFILGAIFVAYIFRYISVRTPLAGDDWGFYVLSQNYSILKRVFEFYCSWSGRIVCETWNFIMSSNKQIWDWINPILFLIIYLCIYFLSGEKNKVVATTLLILAMMFSVYFQIRTQTYTWITGGDYSVPLCLSLLYFLIVDRFINGYVSKGIKIFFCILTNFILLLIGLTIENISLTMIIGIVIIIIYLRKNNKNDLIKIFIINLIVSVIGFCITKFSPGSTSRLLSEHADWINMSIFEKIANGYNYFLEYSFIRNNYTISIFSIVLMGLIWFSKKQNNVFIKIISSFVLMIGIFVVFSQNFIKSESFLIDNKSIFSSIFWPIYVLNVFYVLFNFMPNDLHKTKAIFFLLFGGISASAMIMSPVNGARAYLFLIYYLILVSVIVLNSFDCNNIFSLLFSLVLLFIVYNKTNYYKNLYDLIEYSQEQRLVEIKYYQEHPEDEEVWIKRFPENALHSIDIEKGDDYHFNVFKKYFNLPQDANNIVFFFDKKDNN